MFGKAQQSRQMWLAALAFAAGLNALACGGGGDDDGQKNVNPGGNDASTNPQPTNDSGTNNPQPTNDAGTNPQPTSDAGTNPQPVVDAGPVDLGQDSKDDTFLRADTLVLNAPNLYVPLVTLGINLGTRDATQDGQNTLNDGLTKDANGDGFVDMSMLLRFLKTSDPKTGSGTLAPGGAVCPMPLGPDKACGADKTFPFQSPPLNYANAAQPCMVQGTQESSPAPCFATTPASLTMQLPILGAVPLEEAQVVGTWDGGNVKNGFVRGFLTKTSAAATKLGAGVPDWLGLVGVKQGDPLTKFVSDMQIGKNSKGEDGWWFLMTYTAKAAKFDPAAKVP